MKIWVITIEKNEVIYLKIGESNHFKLFPGDLCLFFQAVFLITYQFLFLNASIINLLFQ